DRAKPYGWRWSEDAELGVHVPAPNHHSIASRIDVALRVRRTALPLVLERITGRDARVIPEGDGPTVSVFAAIEDSATIRRVLLGYGDEIEVLEPPELRREIAERA